MLSRNGLYTIHQVVGSLIVCIRPNENPVIVFRVCIRPNGIPNRVMDIADFVT